MYQLTGRISRRFVLKGALASLGIGALPLISACSTPAATPASTPSGQAAPSPAPASAKSEPTAQAKPTTQAAPQAAATPKARELAGEININFVDIYTHASGWNAVGAKYTEMHPGVKIVVDLKTPRGYPEWVRAQFASGTPASSLVSANYVQDLFFPDEKFIDLLTYTEKISPYTGEAWKEDLLPGALANPHGVTGGIYTFGSDNYQGVWFYNKEAFQKAGIGEDPPKDFDELLRFGEELKNAGYIPLAIEGDATAFSPRRVRWLHDTYFDQFSRPWIEIFRSQPGDWNYRKEIDDVWKYDPSDPSNDSRDKVTVNNIRFLRALRDKEIRVDSDQYREELTNLRKLLGPLTQDGWLGTVDAYPLFVAQKAAMYIDVTSVVTRLDKDVMKLGGDAKPFAFGAFNFPSMNTPLVVAPTRGREGSLAFYGIPKKQRQQNDLEMDFVMYFTGPEGIQTYLNASLDPSTSDGFINGLPTIKHAKLPEAVAEKFDAIPQIGAHFDNPANQLAYGWSDANQAWVDLAQQFYADKITLDDFLSQYAAEVEKVFPQVLEKQKLTNADLDTPEKRPAQQ